jgi:hypothetical protein
MAIDTWDDGDESCYFNEISDPRILEACSKTSKAKEMDDTPSFDTAIRS